jgi:hypothetical protein
VCTKRFISSFAGTAASGAEGRHRTAGNYGGPPKRAARWRAQEHASRHVHCHSPPECRTEFALHRLVSEHLLRDEGARPAAREGEQVQRAFRRAPGARRRRSLVLRVGNERDHTHAGIHRREPERVAATVPQRPGKPQQRAESQRASQCPTAPASRGAAPGVIEARGRVPREPRASCRSHRVPAGSLPQ